MRNYFNSFIHDESGMELLQEAIIVVIAVSLITVVSGLGNVIGDRISAATQYVEENVNVGGANGGGAGAP